MQWKWLIAVIVFLTIVIFPYTLFVVLPVWASIELLQRKDLSGFQQWSLFLLTWLIPLVGAITSLITLRYALPRYQS